MHERVESPPARGQRRIGLFGGSFDPVHAGHLHAARAALAAFQLDRVVFVPAFEPPHKPGRALAPGRDRLAMLRLAIAGEPRFDVSDLELARGGRSYTIDTVRALPAEIGEPADCAIHLILGSDNLTGLAGWRDAGPLLDSVEPIVVHRDDDARGCGAEDAALAEIEARLGPQRADKVRRGRLTLPPVRASATSVRARLAHGEAAVHELPPAVARYIDAHRLYRAASATPLSDESDDQGDPGAPSASDC